MLTAKDFLHKGGNGEKVHIQINVGNNGCCGYGYGKCGGSAVNNTEYL
jgi:hypothetical protein